MKKILLVINLLLFCFLVNRVSAQVYQEMPQYGYRANRMIFDSTLSIPTTCGVPTLRSNITKKAAIAFDSCNNKLYQYNPKTLTWSEIAGGGSTDTTSLSNRINLKLNISDTASMLSPYLRKADTTNKWVNNITRTPGKDSIIFYIGSNRYAIKDSVGSTSGFVPYSGATSNVDLGTNDLISRRLFANTIEADGLFYLRDSYLGGVAMTLDTFYNNVGILKGRINIKGDGSFTKITATSTATRNFNLPDSSGTAALKEYTVNTITRTPGKDSIIFYVGSTRYAIKDSVGSGGGSVAVDTIYRTLGKDSIFYIKNGNTYAIKDSVGTNPAPVGYYGAFQDTTTQTAASINTAYSVKLNRTDLSNGVSVVNDGSGNPTRITLANTGIYNIQFSLQLEKTGGSGNMIVDIWIRKNGVNIPSTTGKVVLTGSANASPIIAAWNYVLDLAAGDYIQLMWSTSNTNVEIVAAGATAPYPSIPSAILTVTQQSGIMAGTGITAINSLTGAAQTITTGTTGTDFAISSSGTTHTLNLPTASATNRGALSSTDWSTFNGKLNTSDSTIYYTKFRSDTSRTNIYNQLAQELNIADSTIYYTKFRSDTSRSNIYSAINTKSAGYALMLGALAGALTGGGTIYFGHPSRAAAGTAAIHRIYIPQSGTIKSVYIISASATAGTNESWTMSVRLNNASNTSIGSVSAATTTRVWSGTGLNIAVVAGDYIEITTTNPTWATAPGTTSWYGTIYIQ